LSASFVVPQLAVGLSLPADVEGVGFDDEDDDDEAGVIPVGCSGGSDRRTGSFRGRQRDIDPRIAVAVQQGASDSHSDRRRNANPANKDETAVSSGCCSWQLCCCQAEKARYRDHQLTTARRGGDYGLNSTIEK
jgi:hypothetical protein